MTSNALQKENWKLCVPIESDIEWYKELIENQASELRNFVAAHNLDESKFEPIKPLWFRFNSARHGIEVAHTTFSEYLMNIHHKMEEARAEAGLTGIIFFVDDTPPSQQPQKAA